MKALQNPRVGLLEARLLELVRQRIADLELSQREIERRLRISHGTLNNLLNGSTALKFRHLEALGKLLDCTTDELLLDALGVPFGLRRPAEEGRDRAFRNLEDLILKVERNTSADLGRIRAEVLALGSASFRELVGVSRIFFALMTRFTEIVALFTGWLERHQPEEEGTEPSASRPN